MGFWEDIWDTLTNDDKKKENANAISAVRGTRMPSSDNKLTPNSRQAPRNSDPVNRPKRESYSKPYVKPAPIKTSVDDSLPMGGSIRGGSKPTSPSSILGPDPSVGGGYDPINDIIGDIQNSMKAEYQGIDPAVKAMIEGAYGSRFGSIDKAEGTANANFGKSKADLEGLYAGHVSDIQNVDSARYQDISNNWQQGISQTFDKSIQAAQGDRNAERQRGEEMLQRLGIQTAAPMVQDNANVLSEGIQGMEADKASYVNQAQGYGSADLARNVARGQAVASEGVARQGDLAQQLQSILGNLGNARVETEQEKAMALLEADQQSRSAWQDGRAMNVESLATLLDQRSRETQQRYENTMRDEDRMFERSMFDREMAAKQAETAQKSVGAGGIFAQIGQELAIPDIAQWRDAYSDFAVEGNYNSTTGIPLEVALSRYFDKRGLPRDHNGEVALRLAKTGTFKNEL